VDTSALLSRAVAPLAITVHGVSEGFPILAATRGMEDVSGRTQRSLEESPLSWLDPVDPEDEGRLVRGLADTLLSKRSELRFRYRMDGGGVRWISLTVAVSDERAGAPIEFICAWRDVTASHEYQQALRDQMDALRRSNVELEQFAHIASHDLSEPLRMVASYTRLIAERYADELDDDARDFIGFAASGADRMQAMIRDLLTYSRLGQAEPDRTPLDLGKVVDSVETMLYRAIDESGARIDRDSDLPQVLMSEPQCRTVLQNLVANSLKFRHMDRTPVISIRADSQGDQWRISVSDNGIGIDETHHERVFEVFRKLHQPDQYPGTGLGLALCRRVINHHGGTMGLDSVPGEGTTVWFTLDAVVNGETTVNPPATHSAEPAPVAVGAP